MENNLINDERLNELLLASPAERVTKEYISNRIEAISYKVFNQVLTVCTLRLDNGFTAIGQSACVNPENYNEEIGRRVSYDRAFDQLWPVFGFLLSEKKFLKSRVGQ